jgi:type IV pilus assembly protein PilY1
MKFCFPADISVIPYSDTNLLMYAADVYGRIWKVTYDYNVTDTSRRWEVKHIFNPNPGSDMASGSVADFIAGPSLVSTDAGRKAFYSPDVSLFGNDWTGKTVLYYGTGDREHPRYTMISNRFYVVVDTDELIDETDLLNLTCDELDDNADSNGDGSITGEDTDVKYELSNLLYDGSALGWYRVLDAQTNCPDNLDASGNPIISHVGESILSQPSVFFKNVYFTSYQPTFADPCNPMGNAFIYALDYSFGAATFNYEVNNDTTEGEVRTLTDTYRMISNTAIPSGVKIITRDGAAAGMVSVGGALVGVGEEGSTTIPGPPGGITPLRWETD